MVLSFSFVSAGFSFLFSLLFYFVHVVDGGFVVLVMILSCSPERLLKRWNETGTNMLSKTQGGMDHPIELSLQLVAHSLNAIIFLQVLSILPAGKYHAGCEGTAGGMFITTGGH